MKNGFIIDLDGTIYSGEKLIDGACDFFSFLKANDIPYVLLTNCPSHSREDIASFLHSFHIEVPISKILTSGILATLYLHGKGYGKVYVVGGPALKAAVAQNGLKLDDENPEAVLIGWDSSITCKDLQRAYDFITEGKPLYATNPDDVIPGNNCTILHTGTFTKLLENAARVKAKVLGKPSKEIWPYVRSQLGEDCIPCVIGDTLAYDIAFALNNKIDAALVLTGLTTRAMAEPYEYEIKIIDTLRDLID